MKLDEPTAAAVDSVSSTAQRSNCQVELTSLPKEEHKRLALKLTFWGINPQA